MKMRFIGQYTGGRNTICYLDCTFTGHEPREVSAEVLAMLDGHPEFELVQDEEPAPVVEQPAKKRGRPRKVS